MTFKVFKFGGASVQDADHIKNVFKILSNYQNDNLLVVISALGKTTNALENQIENIAGDPEKISIFLDDIIKRHLDIASNLELDIQKLKASYSSILEDCKRALLSYDNVSEDFAYDQIVSMGEFLSTHLVNQYVQQQSSDSGFQDVREVFVTENVYRRAKVLIKQTNALVNKKIRDLFPKYKIIITQGFIGRSEEGYTTTLGREGSDYSAALFAYCLDAEEVTIWKDVPGILTADPKRFENVEKIDKMSYREAIEMTYYGAKVIHPKTIQPIQNKGIRLNVNSYVEPDKIGTVISSKGLLNYPPIVVFEDKVVLIQISSNDFSFIQEDHLSYIFKNLNDCKIRLLTMRNSAISFTLCIKDPGQNKLNQFLEGLGNNFGTDVFNNLHLIAIRHFTKSLIEELTKNKIIMFEEIHKDTVQLVVKTALGLKEKS